MKKSKQVITTIIMCALQCAFALVLGVLFQLPFEMTLICGSVYLLAAPILIRSYRKQSYEKQRFLDLCSYLRQMNLSFINTGNILSALKETEEMFLAGKMKSTIYNAIHRIENTTDDIRAGETEALNIVEQEYECDKIKDLHDYMLYAQRCGGNFEKEFHMIDDSNEVWRIAVWNYRKKLVCIRNTTILFFLILLGINGFVLHYLNTTFELTSMRMVQITNMIEIISFLLVVLVVQQKINHSFFSCKKSKSFKSVQSKSEISKAFPKWLFHVLLLAQSESMEGAILHSKDHAPLAIRVELEKLCSELSKRPGEQGRYLSFLKEYKLEEVETSMKDLYAISKGCGNPELMSITIKRCLQMLAISEEKSLKKSGELKSAYQYIPLIITTGGMMVYLLALMIESFRQISMYFEI